MKIKPVLIFAFLVMVNLKAFTQKRDSTVDIYSRVSCYVKIYSGNRLLGNATGFFFNTGKKIYFITNNHVVGGKFFIDEYKQISKQEPPQNMIADMLAVRVYGKKLNDTLYLNLQTRLNNVPTYLTFKNSFKINDTMDVVAIPIPANTVAPNNIDIIALSERDLQPGLVLYPSYDLFIVGFPYDLQDSTCIRFGKERRLLANQILSTPINL